MPDLPSEQESFTNKLDAAVVVPQIGPLAMTVTMGLCQAKEEMELHQAIERADKALYEGKKAGRDRCVVAPD